VNILEQVRHFPGKQKIFIEGNHDTFCHQNNFRRSLQMMYSSPEFYYVSGRATIIDDNAPTSHSRDSQGAIGLCGAMGWVYNEKMDDQRDFIMLQKQLELLDESLTQLERLREEQYTETNICLLHYPPTYRIFTDGRMSNESLFHKILDYKFIDKIVYGHLHKETEFKIYTKVKNVELYCAVIDQLGFQPIRIK
jgi:predicted phosphohydrolase